MLIAGDIGGTHTRLALVAPESSGYRIVIQEEFSSQDFASLAPVVRLFASRHQVSARVACFCVAGPVIDGSASLTNLPWHLDENVLALELGMSSVALLNDLRAIAWAVPHLAPDEITTLNPGAPVAHGPIAILAPGTGLGESFLVHSGTDWLACASEGGHADFAPIGSTQTDLLMALTKRFGRVSYERVCAGSGIPNVYEFFRNLAPERENPALAARLKKSDDRAPTIVAAALDPGHPDYPDPLALDTVRLVVDVWGAEAGNLALKTLATGGVFLAGGMPARLSSVLHEEGFLHHFTAKGRFRGMMQAIPVHVVKVNAALRGAARYGLRLLANES